MLALDTAQIDADLALQLQVLWLAQIMLQQDEFGRDGGVGLQLEHEVPVGPLQVQQGPRGARDKRLDLVEGGGGGTKGRGVVHAQACRAF